MAWMRMSWKGRKLMDVEPFNRWFASYFGQDEKEVDLLLQDRLSTNFLLAWSMLESKCFAGQMTTDKLLPYANSTAALDILKIHGIRNATEFLHTHYRNEANYRDLLRRDKSDAFRKVIDTDYKDLKKPELVFMLLFVVYRFRHNIFDGDKGVRTWLKFHFEIELCTGVMQALLTMAGKNAKV
jgi:hypothetical protein